MRSNRRRFVQTLGVGSAGVALAAPLPATPEHPVPERSDKQVLYVGDKIALTQTEYGKVRGYMLRGVNYFLGMPYGADTSGANRFMPPQKPKPWTNVFPALWWGNS
ncbi:MAG: carboxylesterase family protein, partial [Bryobacteraceae bacterium]